MLSWFFAWVIALEMVGLATLPLTVRVLAALPDRGFLFAKPLGLLVVGYVAWLSGMMGVLRYQQGTLLVITILVGAACWGTWGRGALKQLAGLRGLILGMEAVWLLAFAASALVRAHNPEIAGTEKPMDFAFLNAIYRSESLPPEDPWLSGFGISYYYFGYFLLATLAKLSAVPASVAYNLGVAVVFALLLAGCFSIAFNLLSAIRPTLSLFARFVGALLAPVTVGVMGNLEVALEILAARGYSNPSFWQWVGIKNLQPVTDPQSWTPSGHWWWWRASRVIPTTQPDGINEFPYFSFLLGDLHPHYSALPWVLLCIGLSLALILGRTEGFDATRGWVGRVVAAVALGFLLVGNSWDFPTYTALYWLAALAPLCAGEWRRDRLATGVRQLVPVSVLSVLLYLPFFPGFSSQTRGIGLSADRTPLASLVIIFGAVLVCVTAFLAWRSLGNGLLSPSSVVSRWLALSGGVLVLAAPVATFLLPIGLLCMGISAYQQLVGQNQTPDRPIAASLFHLLVIAAGIVLILVPEFVFINDLFGTRMNTVFKFHYQAWVLLGIAASVAMVRMSAESRSAILRLGVGVLFALLAGIGLLYPLLATSSKAQDFKSQPTLDGAAYYQSVRPDDYAAIQWLSQNATGRPVVLEATGGQYSEYARVSTFTGLPTVLGWGGHEAQWGRPGQDLQQRTRDIDTIYSGAARETVLALLGKYRVQYVVVGSLELEKYGPEVVDRFSSILEPAYRQGRVAVYRVPARQGSAQYMSPGSWLG